MPLELKLEISSAKHQPTSLFGTFSAMRKSTEKKILLKIFYTTLTVFALGKPLQADFCTAKSRIANGWQRQCRRHEVGTPWAWKKFKTADLRTDETKCNPVSEKPKPTSTLCDRRMALSVKQIQDSKNRLDNIFILFKQFSYRVLTTTIGLTIKSQFIRFFASFKKSIFFFKIAI